MSCDCTDYPPIELDRQSISRRIRQSPQIAEDPELWLYLFRCPECGQFWQSGHEWNFADREYLFQVPAIEANDWKREPYQQPAAMMIYSALMRDFCARAAFEIGDSPCRAEGCTGRAMLRHKTWANERPGVDAGWRVSFAFQRPWTRATQREH